MKCRRSTQNPHVVDKPPDKLFISRWSLCHQVVELFPYQLRADFNLKFVLLRFLVAVVADLGEINLVGTVSIAHSVLHSIITAITNWQKMVHLSFPRAFDGDGYPEIEGTSRIVDFEVGNTRLNDLCLLCIGLQICRNANFRLLVAFVHPLSYGRRQLFSPILCKLEELVSFVRMGIE